MCLKTEPPPLRERLMRTRSEITQDRKRPEFLELEVLLDIRDLLSKQAKPKRVKKVKRSVKRVTKEKE